MARPDVLDVGRHETSVGARALAARGNQSPGGVERYHGVQSYGILVSAGIPKGSLPSPGFACNGHTGFLSGGGE